MIADKQKGVSLIITFFIMIIILSVVFSVSALLYSEIKVIRNIGNSVISFYAANSGIEKVLYYDDQVLPESASTDADGNQTITVGPRGLCSMYPYNYLFNSLITNTQWTNTLACPDSSVVGLDNVVYCNVNNAINSGMPQSLSSDHDGCDPSVCDNCQIAFTGTLDNGATYSTTAKVFPSSNALSTSQTSNFEINSVGNFGGAGRQIKISISAIKAKDVIQIGEDCASPKSTGQGESVSIQANVSIGIPGNDTIGSVTATVSDASGNCYNAQGTVAPSCSDPTAFLPLTNTTGNFASSLWSLSPVWTTDLVQEYYVSLTATDTLCTACSVSSPCQTGSNCCNGVCSTTDCSTPSCTDNIKTITEIPPCGF